MSTTARNAFSQCDPTTPPDTDPTSQNPTPNPKAQTEPASPPIPSSTTSNSSLIIEELSRDDPAYSNPSVLHPDELEEQSSSSSETDKSQDSTDNPSSDAALTRRMRHLRTRDRPSAALIRGSSSAGGRKRARSQSSIAPDTDTESVVAADEDGEGSARRLRRRVRAPLHYSPVLADAADAVAASELSEQISDGMAGEAMDMDVDIDQSSQSTLVSAD
ncbi:hypothetical protein BDV97DRAFT_365360 [Delphinella strobiligena]|nr:hypothetical protein BDV97DRAFT_365360 [Delphinella strobiligena]